MGRWAACPRPGRGFFRRALKGQAPGSHPVTLCARPGASRGAVTREHRCGEAKREDVGCQGPPAGEGPLWRWLSVKHRGGRSGVSGTEEFQVWPWPLRRGPGKGIRSRAAGPWESRRGLWFLPGVGAEPWGGTRASARVRGPLRLEPGPGMQQGRAGAAGWQGDGWPQAPRTAAGGFLGWGPRRGGGLLGRCAAVRTHLSCRPGQVQGLAARSPETAFSRRARPRSEGGPRKPSWAPRLPRTLETACPLPSRICRLQLRGKSWREARCGGEGGGGPASTCESRCRSWGAAIRPLGPCGAPRLPRALPWCPSCGPGNGAPGN